MVERVKITPSKIVLKDSTGAVKFNTDSFYIKTGGGTLYAGGYARAPAIYGQNSIYDHTEYGGYCAGILSGVVPTTLTFNVQANVPKAQSYTHRSLPSPTYGGDPLGLPFISPSSRFVEYFNFDTDTASNTNITFYWKIQQYGYVPADNGEGGTTYGGVQWEMEPILSNNTLPGQSNPNGGGFRFGFTANEHLNYTTTINSVDENGSPITITQYGSQYYGAQGYVDENGQPYTVPAKTITFRGNAIFNTKDPVSLSLAVTP